MNRFLIGFASVFLIGCAHKERSTYFPPSATAVVQSVASAKTNTEKLRPFVLPEGKPTLEALSASLDSAQIEVAAYSGKVDDLVLRLTKAEDQAAYEHEKRMKALKEVWFWRLLALTIAGITLAGVGLKTGWKFFL